MIYLFPKKRLSAAYELANECHKNQVDKVGRPYMEHLERVSNRGKSTSAKIVGLLHDVVEDGHISKEELIKLPFLFSEEIHAILLLSKNIIFGGDIPSIKKFPLAREVKINDLLDNLDLGRFTRSQITPSLSDLDRALKYEYKLRYLQGPDFLEYVR